MAAADTELHSVRDEFLAAATAIGQIQARFSSALAKSEERTSELQNQVVSLEAEKTGMALQIRWLQTQNAELRGLLDDKPDVSKAIDARKLNHARRVIRDLVDQQKTGKPIHSRSSLQREETTQVADGESSSDESWNDMDFVEAESSFEDEDNPKAQPNQTTVQASNTNQKNQPKRRSQSRSQRRSRDVTMAPQGSKKGAPDDPAVPPSSNALPPTPPPDAQEEWYIEYSKPPATAPVSRGPFRYPILQERLGLDDETMICIEGLEWMRDPCMRIHIHDDMVFVLQPLVLEGPLTTYLINWGTQIINRNVKRYITHGVRRPANSVFHMFVNPDGRDSWWYLGAHQLVAMDLQSVWRTKLRKEDKKRLSFELEKRWSYSPLDSRDIAQRIQSGELEQCCLELRSDGEQARSNAFLEQRLKVKA